MCVQGHGQGSESQVGCPPDASLRSVLTSLSGEHRSKGSIWRASVEGELLNTDNVCWQEDLLPQYHRMFEMIARSAGSISSMNLATKRCVERYSSAKSRKSQGTQCHACLYIAHDIVTLIVTSPHSLTSVTPWGKNMVMTW